MIKLELNADRYFTTAEDGRNATAVEVLKYIVHKGYLLFYDIWPEGHLYFGKHRGKSFPVDHIFGNSRFSLAQSYQGTFNASCQLLRTMFYPEEYVQKRQFDVIAIKRPLYKKMESFFLKSSS